MINWEDLKYFLAVCRAGSIRGAANSLDVNHATVSRRISSFEKSLDVRLFERTQKGYIPTPAAEGILMEANHLEERLNSIDRKLLGKNNALEGEIRVTIADTLSQELFIDEFALFAKTYPNIDLEIIESTRTFNLINREADVAIRVGDSPPGYLVGTKLADLHRAVYISHDFAEYVNDKEWLSSQSLIGWTSKMRRPGGKLLQDYPKFNSKHSMVSAILQTKACKLGMGVAVLPCFIADLDPELIRVPPYTSEKKNELWLLSHPDLRSNKKIQTFLTFIKTQMRKKLALMQGEFPLL